MKKKYLWIPALAGVVLLAVITAGMRISVGDAARVEIRSGLTGKSVEITEAAQIQAVTELVTGPSYGWSGWSGSGKNGYAYRIDWFDTQGSRIESITILDRGGAQIRRGGNRYHVRGGGLNTEELERILG